MLSRLQCTFLLNQNNVNDYIKPCTRQSLKCMHGIMLCPGITLTLATPLAEGDYTKDNLIAKSGIATQTELI